MKRALSTLSLVAALALPTSILAAAPASVAPLLQSFVDKHELAGAVALVVDSKKVLSVEAVGFADIAGKKAMKTDSLFWIASQSKTMTATAARRRACSGTGRWSDSENDANSGFSAGAFRVGLRGPCCRRFAPVAPVRRP